MLLSKWSWLCLCHSHSDTWRGLKRRHLSYQNSSWNCPQCPHTIWKLSQINPMLIQIHLQMDATMNNEWPDGCRGWENGVELGIFLQASVDCSSQLVLNSLPVVSANALQMINGKEITIWNINGPMIKYRIYWHFTILTLFCLSQKTMLIALGREKIKLKNYPGIEGCCLEIFSDLASCWSSVHNEHFSTEMQRADTFDQKIFPSVFLRARLRNVKDKSVQNIDSFWEDTHFWQIKQAVFW